MNSTKNTYVYHNKKSPLNGQKYSSKTTSRKTVVLTPIDGKKTVVKMPLADFDRAYRQNFYERIGPVCRQCGNIYDADEIARAYGEGSGPATLRFCSSQCYTKNLQDRIVNSILVPETGESFDHYVTIENFLRHNGELLRDREIYSKSGDRYIVTGYYKEFDEKTQCHLGYNVSYKTFPYTATSHYVKIQATPIYR